MKGQKPMADGFLVVWGYSVQEDLKYEVGRTMCVKGLDDRQLMVMLHIDSEAVEHSIAVPERESILG